MREGISTSKINIDQELRILKGEWISSKDDMMLLTPKALDLVKQVESFFRVQKKKTSADLMGDEFKANIAKYQLIFPKKKLPSGKAARSADSNVETNFRWFFEKHQYSWDTILKATSMYLDEYERKTPQYMYMRTSAYFIRKTELDKSVVSDLANYCDIIESGDFEEDSHFSEKVF